PRRRRNIGLQICPGQPRGRDWICRPRRYLWIKERFSEKGGQMRVRFRHGVLALAICAALAAGAAAVGIGQSGGSGATVLTTPVERGDIQV
ncbi:hypothetical protein Q0N68_13835, partial [Staphylococcus aureus]|nr:hypothetical protein [Staphylococcus aureus]